MVKIYLAGPEVFLPDARAVGEKKKVVCAEFGLVGLYPLDNEVGREDDSAARTIFEGNVAMMRSADVIVANLTPFRGVSADPGTVFEVGVGFAWGKRVFGYSHSPLTLIERTERRLRARRRWSPDDERFYGADGLALEDFGHGENLMIAEAIKASGGVFLSGEASGWSDLGLFRACLSLVAERGAELTATGAPASAAA